MNLRPSGYEPDELPSCSTPRQRFGVYHSWAKFAIPFLIFKSLIYVSRDYYYVNFALGSALTTLVIGYRSGIILSLSKAITMLGKNTN